MHTTRDAVLLRTKTVPYKCITNEISNNMSDSVDEMGGAMVSADPAWEYGLTKYTSEPSDHGLGQKHARYPFLVRV